MNKKNIFASFGVLMLAILFSGCAKQVEPYDYSNFKTHHPKSILVLPPANETTDVKATAAVYATTVLPLAESGYYVFPPSLVAKTFKENGIHDEESHNIPLSKLYDIFGADSVLYIRVTEYGSSYRVIESEIEVRLEAKLVDTKSGQILWTGEASASSRENKNNNNNSVLGALISAVIDQIANELSDESFTYAGIANGRLLHAGGNGNMLYGYRSPHFQQ